MTLNTLPLPVSPAWYRPTSCLTQVQMSSTPQDTSTVLTPNPEELDKYTYDPHKGVDENYEGPFETEI